MRNNIFLWMIFYTIPGFTVDCGLINRPKNTEVVVGQRVRLHCSTSDIYNVNWEHFPTGSAASKSYVFFGGGMIIPYHRRFSVDRGSGNSGQYDLVISSVESSDAGRYRCIDREGQGEQAETELVVLASLPQCYADELVGENSCGIEAKEDVRVHCSVLYSGNVVPLMKCSNFSNLQVKSDVVLNPGNVSYVLVLKPEPQMIGSPHTCYTSLSNITSDAFNFSVTYVAESPVHMEINQRTQLTCTANSTTTCSYKWISKNGNITSTNRTTGIDVPGKYRCEADCLIQGQMCTVQCLEVTYVGLAIKDSSTMIAIIAAVVAISLLLTAISISLVVIVVRRKRKMRRAVTHQPPPTSNCEDNCAILLNGNEYS